MTKEWNLELHDGVYCEKLKREINGQPVDWYRKLLCEGFVKAALRGGEAGEKIRVSVTDQKPSEANGAVEVKVMRQGYYRWSWRFVTEASKAFNSSFGFYRSVEEILMGMFPNEWEKDKENKDKSAREVTFLFEQKSVEEHSLWVRIAV